MVRPSIAGLMGAYGAALIALDAYEIGEETTLLSLEELAAFTSEKEFTHCGLCENNCQLTVTVFSDGRQFITGNRCERGARIKIKREERKVNLVDYKYRKLFKYRPLRENKAFRGRLGIPRVLNMYENYPLWHTFFTDLGFRVELSPRSNKQIYEQGLETIPSDTVCYPAKMAHGHIQALIDYRNPYLNLANETAVAKVLAENFADLGISLEEIQTALHHGYQELAAFKKEIQEKGEETLAMLTEKGQRGIVLSGRPYHLDPEINHGIAEVITQEGFHVLTEDSISHLGDVQNLRVVNQWVYHSRLYAAAKVVAKTKNLELVQLNSFGCGLDAVTTDQVEEIMDRSGKIYTVLKIDEGANLGAIRIRLRSLKAAVNEREKQQFVPHMQMEEPEKIVFTKQMKKTHTLLLPMLSPIHQSGLVDVALQASGYHVVCLPAQDKEAVNVGLKYVNNDACYPAIISIGQLVEALESGQYDLDNVSVLMTQTGGGCRATNYIPLLRKALNDAGFSQVPVVSVSMGNKGVESNPGFKFTLPMIKLDHHYG